MVHSYRVHMFARRLQGCETPINRRQERRRTRQHIPRTTKGSRSRPSGWIPLNRYIFVGPDVQTLSSYLTHHSHGCVIIVALGRTAGHVTFIFWERGCLISVLDGVGHCFAAFGPKLTVAGFSSACYTPLYVTTRCLVSYAICSLLRVRRISACVLCYTPTYAISVYSIMRRYMSPSHWHKELLPTPSYR